MRELGGVRLQGGVAVWGNWGGQVAMGGIGGLRLQWGVVMWGNRGVSGDNEEVGGVAMGGDRGRG